MRPSHGSFHISAGKVVALEKLRQVEGHGQALAEAIAQGEEQLHYLVIFKTVARTL